MTELKIDIKQEQERVKKEMSKQGLRVLVCT